MNANRNDPSYRLIISPLCAGPRVTYVPPELPQDEDSIFAHYQTGINFEKYDDLMVDVSGSNPPQAIMVSSVGLLAPGIVVCVYIGAEVSMVTKEN